MTDFKTIKHFNCSLDFNLTDLLMSESCHTPMLFLEEVNFFFIDGLTISMLKVPPNMLLETLNFNHHGYFW